MKAKDLIDMHLRHVSEKIRHNEMWIKDAEKEIEKRKKRMQELEEADLNNQLAFASETFVSIGGGSGTSNIRACPCGPVSITSECINIQEVRGEYT